MIAAITGGRKDELGYFVDGADAATENTLHIVPNSDRILLVEDDRDSLEALFVLLTREGYSVLTASNGQQALDLLVHGIQPRLLIIDLMLPKVNGADILKHAQGDPRLRHMPVVVITALSPDEFSVVADVVLQKPIDYAVLLSTVRRLMSADEVAPLKRR